MRSLLPTPPPSRCQRCCRWAGRSQPLVLPLPLSLSMLLTPSLPLLLFLSLLLSLFLSRLYPLLV